MSISFLGSGVGITRKIKLNIMVFLSVKKCFSISNSGVLIVGYEGFSIPYGFSV